MANTKNNKYILSNTKQMVPESSNGTGTISTVGKGVVGVGTLFATQLPAGSWLVDLTANEYRKVATVISNTEAYLTEAFSADIAGGTTPNIIHFRNTHAVSIGLQVPTDAATDALVDGVAFAKGTSLTFSKDSRITSSTRDFIDPILVDASGTEVQVMIQR